MLALHAQDGTRAGGNPPNRGVNRMQTAMPAETMLGRHCDASLRAERQSSEMPFPFVVGGGVAV
jgi:hypothetical protein